MKIIKLLFFMVFCIVVFLTCQNNDNGTIYSLKGTKWKLKCIVDSLSGKQTVLEPIDCEECFTLVFDTDSTAIVRSINMETLTLNLKELDPNQNLSYNLWWELYDKDGKYYLDGDPYRRAILTSESYWISTKELKLYYPAAPGDVNYLLFKPL